MKAILEIDMPESCHECPMAIARKYCCFGDELLYVSCYECDRHNDCPLKAAEWAVKDGN